MDKRVALVIVLLIGGLMTGVVLAWDNQPPTNITPTAPKPGWTGTQWTLRASAGTALGDAVCVEFALDSNGGCDSLTDYTRFEGTYHSDLGGGKHRWDFTITPPNVFKNVTAPAVVCYQFYVDADNDNCEPGGGGYTNSYTGFNWSFNTGPNAITLRTLEAEARTPALPGLALLGVLAAFGVGFAFRRRRTV
jgi:hypothetical protein